MSSSHSAARDPSTSATHHALVSLFVFAVYTHVYTGSHGRGGPRLHTVLSLICFISYHRLPALAVWDIVPENFFSLQMPVGENFGRIDCAVYVRMKLQFLPAQYRVA